MKSKIFAKKQAGITLTEIMVSLFLITILAGTVLTLLIQNMKMGSIVDYHYAASKIASNRIARIRELRRDSGYDELDTAQESPGVTVDREGSYASDGEFTRTTTITCPYNENDNLTKVGVSVSFKAPGAFTTSTTTLTTLLSKYITGEE